MPVRRLAGLWLFTVMAATGAQAQAVIPPIPPPTPPPLAVPLPLIAPPGNPLTGPGQATPPLNSTWPSTRNAPPELYARCGAQPTAELQRSCVAGFQNDLSQPPPRN